MINLYLKNFNFNLSNSIGILLLSENEKENLTNRLKKLKANFKICSFLNLKSYFKLDGMISAPLGFPFKDIERFLSSKIILLEDTSITSMEDAALFNALCSLVLSGKIVLCIKKDIFHLYDDFNGNFPECLIIDIYKTRFRFLVAAKMINDINDNGYTPSLSNLIKKIASLGFNIETNHAMLNNKGIIKFYDEKNFEIALKITHSISVTNPGKEFIYNNGVLIDITVGDIYFSPGVIIERIKIFRAIAGSTGNINVGRHNKPLIKKLDHTAFSKTQELALKELNSAHLAIAGAGSGKTRLIVHKFLHLLNFIPFNSILVLTFTNNAVIEIKNRILSALKDDGIDKGLISEKILNVYTYHSFFYSIIREFYRESGFSSMPIIKENNFDYNNTDDNNIYISYDDIIACVVKLFENDTITYSMAKRFKYILVDEYQDLDFLSDYIIKKIDYGRDNIMYAGDDDQSIYRFNGGDHFNILFFDLFFPDGKIFVLQNNYRSNYKIINFCNFILNNIAFRFPKKLIPPKNTVKDDYINAVKILRFKNKNSEVRFILNEFGKFFDLGKSVSILVRTQKEVDHFKFVFKELYPNAFLSYKEYDNRRFIGTIHGSKGLEFDIVFVANVIQGNIPHFKSIMPKMHEPEALKHPFLKFLNKNIKINTPYDDEVKLFYVAVSRAKEIVFISYSGEISEFLRRNF
ncbi:MAG TPA: hypothetical protein ENI54_04300 [bacterium]|nr:hypothetical protein [bacterium]